MPYIQMRQAAWSRIAASCILVLVAFTACRGQPPTALPGTTEPPPTQQPPTDIPTPEAVPSPIPPTAEPVEGGRLDAASIPKYNAPLIIPPVMPSDGTGDWDGTAELATEYRIAVRQFEQQILPEGFPTTTVWGYGRLGDPLPGAGGPTTFNSPAFTIEARTGERIRVEWVNQLVDDPAAESRQFLSHLLPVDQTLHWANPLAGPDMEGTDPEPYLGPVPIITHVHGAHVPTNSDGYPEAWYLPDASNIPDGYVTQGTFYDTVQEAHAGSAVFEYPNDQRATTLWYHDHTLGMTRLNVYAGLAGFWIIRDDVEEELDLPGPAPQAGDPPDTRYYEIPIVIQDRSFNEDGSLFYPDTREFFDEYSGPYIPDTTVPPIWNPEVFGDTIMVNGRTWPYLDVEPRLYRFRFLNGSNARFLILKFDTDLTFHQIGTEGGLLPGSPIELDNLLMGPAERADVIVDFSQFQPGDEIVLLNLGPDSPFGGLPIDPGDVADPETTGQIMQFRVVDLTDQGTPGTIPTALPPIDRLETTLTPRDVTLNELMYQPADIPVEAELGTGADGPISWDHDITENPMVNDTEIWRILNLTGDAHPIHVHLIMFQVVDRIPFDADAYAAAQADYLAAGGQGDPPDPLDFASGDPRPPNAWEMGWKDTVIANPGEITRIIATFDLEGLYVWHCHILEHEDNEMMRPYYVGAIPPGLPTSPGESEDETP